MGTHYDHLTSEDRKLIARLHEDGIPVTVIALQRGRHKSTVHRELRRNRTDDGPWLRGYFGVAAHQISAMRRRRTAKLHRDPALAAHVIARLKDGWSPEQIAAPSAPWQKGTVENTNGRLRRFLPLDLDVSTKTADELSALAQRMNTTPRKCLGFRTPAEVFDEFFKPA